LLEAGVIRAAFAAGLLLAGVGEVAAAPEMFQVEPEASSAQFAVTHFGVFTQHGRFGGTQGTIVLDAEQRSGSIDLVIDATSINTGWHARDAWLRGEEMFDVAHYPVVQFRSTKLVFDQARLTGIAGLLTLHGVTRPIELKVERIECGGETGKGRDCGAGAVSTIRRSQFGMDYALGLVSDEVELSLQITARWRPQ
jgi:polyisoprenoid-binding protein YceI